MLVQTTAPDAPAIAAAAQHDTRGFVAGELARRRALDYPPFADLIRVVCSAGGARPAARGGGRDRRARRPARAGRRCSGPRRCSACAAGTAPRSWSRRTTARAAIAAVRVGRRPRGERARASRGGLLGGRRPAIELDLAMSASATSRPRSPRRIPPRAGSRDARAPRRGAQARPQVRRPGAAQPGAGDRPLRRRAARRGPPHGPAHARRARDRPGGDAGRRHAPRARLPRRGRGARSPRS